MGLLLAAGAVWAGGCEGEGTVELSWTFPPLAGGNGEPETAAAGCGNHGIDSLLLTGANDAGEGGNFIALCTPGTVRRGVAIGNWSFAVHTLDIRGRLIRALEEPDALTEVLVVADGATAVFPTVTLSPRPACSDTVDNDGDGRVDLDDFDDPECVGNPAGTDESIAPQP